MRQLLEQLSDVARTRALTHPAWANDSSVSFERLEFLGDAVLGSIISAELYRRFPEMNEGDLSKIRAATVSREACAQVGFESDLGQALIDAAPASADPALVQGLAGRSRVVAELVESVIGASFLERGYDAIVPEVLASFADRIGHAVDNRTDAKSELQELAQRRGESVEYRVVSTDGPDHDRHFTIVARLEQCGLEATGEGGSKKVAAQEAASRLLEVVARRGQASAAGHE